MVRTVPVREFVRRVVTIGSGVVMGMALFGAAPASAAEVDAAAYAGGAVERQAPWVNPGNATGTWTARERISSRGVIQVRVGYINGVQHGWAQVLNAANSNQHVSLEVDLNGDRNWDVAWNTTISIRNYTYAYPTSPSPNRAFRACVKQNANEGCHASHRTTWW